MKLRGGWLLALGALAVVTPYAGAHFRLLEPQGWLVENNLGDPQKAGPCGGTSTDVGMPSNAVARLKGGQMLHIKVQEIIFLSLIHISCEHPSLFRQMFARGMRFFTYCRWDDSKKLCRRVRKPLHRTR